MVVLLFKVVGMPPRPLSLAQYVQFGLSQTGNNINAITSTILDTLVTSIRSAIYFSMFSRFIVV